MTPSKTEGLNPTALAHCGHDAILRDEALGLIKTLASPHIFIAFAGEADVLRHYESIRDGAIRHATHCANILLDIVETVNKLASRSTGVPQ